MLRRRRRRRRSYTRSVSYNTFDRFRYGTVTEFFFFENIFFRVRR